MAEKSLEKKDPILSDKNWLATIINPPQDTIQCKTQKITPCVKTRIQRVPHVLCNSKELENHYAPKVVSIGPYHHDYTNPTLRRVQDLKRKILRQFVSNNEALLGELHGKLFKKIGEIRTQYKDISEKEYDNEELTRMMLMDGCYILYFIAAIRAKARKQNPPVTENPPATENQTENPPATENLPAIENPPQQGELLEIKTYNVAFIQQDLFLLENQIPFFVLQDLMGKPEDKRLCNMEMINEFITLNAMATPSPSAKTDQDPLHLLDLLHKRLVGEKKLPKISSERYTFRNIDELSAVGIYLKCSPPDKALIDITFTAKTRYAYLYIPEITVDDSTKTKFLNLIAYEMCPDAPENLWITSYICFLDSLIDHPQDVKELRSKKILQNCLGSDEEVATLFNEIGKDLVPNSLAYANEKKEIQTHYENKGKAWMAQFRRTHFKNPWSCLALFGALLALLLSSLQAWFQIWPLDGDCDQLCRYIKMVQHV